MQLKKSEIVYFQQLFITHTKVVIHFYGDTYPFQFTLFSGVITQFMTFDIFTALNKK